MKTFAPPTAILTANDMTAFGVMRGLQKLGLAVPHDVSVVGLDDILFAQVTQPALTSVRIPRMRLARACIDALNYTREDLERTGGQFRVVTQLIVRESTGPAL